MRYWLARTLREARENAKQPTKPKDIAILAGVDSSTINRFEKAQTWPQKIDRVVAAYAALVGVDDGREFWERALREWRASGGAPVLGELDAPRRALLLALETAQRPSPYDGGSQAEPTANPKKRRAR